MQGWWIGRSKKGLVLFFNLGLNHLKHSNSIKDHKKFSFHIASLLVNNVRSDQTKEKIRKILPYIETFHFQR